MALQKPTQTVLQQSRDVSISAKLKCHSAASMGWRRRRGDDHIAAAPFSAGGFWTRFCGFSDLQGAGLLNARLLARSSWCIRESVVAGVAGLFVFYPRPEL